MTDFTQVLSDSKIIREALLPFSFIAVFLGFIQMGLSFGGSPKTWFSSILAIALVTMLIAGYPNLLFGTRDAMITLKEKIEKEQQLSAKKVFSADIGKDPGNAIWDIGNKIIFSAIKTAQNIGKFALVIVEWIQFGTMIFLYSTSPIGLGFLAIRETRTIGVNFLTTSLSVCLWSIGNILVTLMIDAMMLPILELAGLNTVLLGAIGTGALLISASTSLPALLAAMIALSLLCALMYLSVPLIITAVMRGAAPSMASGLNEGMQWAGIASGNASRIASLAGMGKGGGASAVAASGVSGESTGNPSSNVSASGSSRPSSSQAPAPIQSEAFKGETAGSTSVTGGTSNESSKSSAGSNKGSSASSSSGHGSTDSTPAFTMTGPDSFQSESGNTYKGKLSNPVDVKRASIKERVNAQKKTADTK